MFYLVLVNQIILLEKYTYNALLFSNYWINVKNIHMELILADQPNNYLKWRKSKVCKSEKNVQKKLVSSLIYTRV